MRFLKNLVFFALFCSANLYAETYLNSDEVKLLLDKIQSASAASGQNQDLIQKEQQEIQRKVDLANSKRNLENAESYVGSNSENIDKRVESIQNYFASTSSIEEYIYSDNFSYQVICKNNTNCKPTASVESEIFNQKIQIVNEKISNDKLAMAKGLKNIYPLDDKLNLVRQMEQTSYSANNNSLGLNNNYNALNNNSDTNKKKKYVDINDGDVLGKVKITITPNYIKLSKK